jgi:polysaccharide export outer membrane protein
MQHKLVKLAVIMKELEMRGMILGLVLSALLLSGCAASGKDLISSGSRFSESTNPSEGYKLGVGDRLKIIVFEEPSLSGEFVVGATGTISLALIGEVNVIDRSITEVERSLEASFSQGFLRNPRVAVEVASYRPFFILGEVNAPGQYPYLNGLTVLNAIATAQGFSPRAQRKQVFIRRAGDANEQLYSLTPALKAYPGDTIRLGERYF